MGLYEAMCVNSLAYKLSSGPVLTSIEIGFHCHYQGFLPVKSYRPLEMDHVHQQKNARTSPHTVCYEEMQNLSFKSFSTWNVEICEVVASR